MLKIGVIGYGYWGPNIVRNFEAAGGSRVVAICDGNTQALGKAKRAYSHIEAVKDCSSLISSAAVDAVAVVTPVATHFGLAKRALLAGKHVFVEKPFTATAAQAEELIGIAERKRLVIMVDHTFIFTGAVRKIKELIAGGALGKLYYYDSVRVNLGLFQADINVMWDLAPHDFSIMDHLVGERPVAVSANGKAHVNGKEDTAYITVYFRNDMIAHFNVNWLSPVKVRTTLIGGEKKMLVWNDLEADEKVRLYNRGVNVKTAAGRHRRLVSYRSGDMWAPRLDQVEALKAETEYFISCVSTGERPVNDGLAGLRIVRMLEACDRSLVAGGKTVDLEIPRYN